MHTRACGISHTHRGPPLGQGLQREADETATEAEAFKLLARLEDLTLWQMKKVKRTRQGSRTYTYWMASWREGGKTRNVHLGSSRKMDAEEARQKARERKAEALGAPARRCSSSAS
jgi:hypothetical protein